MLEEILINKKIILDLRRSSTFAPAAIAVK
jgi:hypothetical protein